MLDSCVPTRNATEDRRSERDRMSQQCTHCDEHVPAEDWHPVATVRGDDGEIAVHLFCSEECRSAWQADRDAGSD